MRQAFRGTFVAHVILKMIRDIKIVESQTKTIENKSLRNCIGACAFQLKDFKENYGISRQTKYRLLRELQQKGYIICWSKWWLPSEQFYIQVAKLFS